MGRGTPPPEQNQPRDQERVGRQVDPVRDRRKRQLHIEEALVVVGQHVAGDEGNEPARDQCPGENRSAMDQNRDADRDDTREPNQIENRAGVKRRPLKNEIEKCEPGHRDEIASPPVAANKPGPHFHQRPAHYYSCPRLAHLNNERRRSRLARRFDSRSASPFLADTLRGPASAMLPFVYGPGSIAAIRERERGSGARAALRQPTHAGRHQAKSRTSATHGRRTRPRARRRVRQVAGAESDSESLRDEPCNTSNASEEQVDVELTRSSGPSLPRGERSR